MRDALGQHAPRRPTGGQRTGVTTLTLTPRMADWIAGEIAAAWSRVDPDLPDGIGPSRTPFKGKGAYIDLATAEQNADAFRRALLRAQRHGDASWADVLIASLGDVLARPVDDDDATEALVALAGTALAWVAAIEARGDTTAVA